MKRPLVLALGGFSLATAPLVALGQTPAFRSLARAESLAAAGRYSEAERLFGLALASLEPSASRARAAAHFGRALAAHRLVSARPDTAGEQTLRGIIDDYSEASSLDSATYFPAAANNRGLALSALGDHRRAVSAFLAAARATDRARAAFFVRAGLEYADLGLDDSAAWAYRKALADTPGHSAARERLLDLYLQTALEDSLSSLATAVIVEGRGTDLSADVLTSFLRGRSPPDASPLLDSALILLGRKLAVMRVGPADFVTSYAVPLRRVATAHPRLADPVRALLRVYQAVSADSTSSERGGAGWWWGTPGRRTAWSRLLRTLGDHYLYARADTTARRYYLAAVGYQVPYRLEAWVDLAALPPLAELLGSAKSFQQLEVLGVAVARWETNALVSASGDRERLRDFHYMVGYWYTEGEDYERAIREYQRALLLDSTFAPAHVDLGFIYMGLSDVPLAVSHLEKAIALDPRDRTSRNNLGYSYLLRADFPRAIEQLELSHQLGPHLLTAINLGDAYRFAGDPASALRWHREAERSVATRLNDEGYVSTGWRYNYMPLAPDDAETVKRSVLVRTAGEKLAFLEYALSFDYAVLGDFPTAERYFASARARGLGTEFQCFFANKIAATQVFMTLTPAARGWFVGKRTLLLQGADCER